MKPRIPTNSGEVPAQKIYIMAAIIPAFWGQAANA